MCAPPLHEGCVYCVEDFEGAVVRSMSKNPAPCGFARGPSSFQVCVHVSRICGEETEVHAVFISAASVIDER